jgi:ABC-type nitrate/sulfonate/bicarbonate transport system permease component
VSTINVTDHLFTTPPCKSQNEKRLFKWLISNDWTVRSLSITVGLILWQVIGSKYPYSMSSPGAVLKALNSYLFPQILPAAWVSLKTFSLGFAICIVAGIPIGLAMARIKFVRIALGPYVATLNSMPMLALFPLLILLFGINAEIRVAATVMFGLWSVIVNTMTGALRVDVTLEDVGRSFVASGWKRLTTIIIPGSLSYIFAGIRIGFGHAMIGAIVIELEASIVGLGHLLQSYSQALQLAPYFIAVLLLGLFSILFSTVLKRLQRWATMPWARGSRTADWRARRGMRSVINSLSDSPPAQQIRKSRRMLARSVRPIRLILGCAYRVLAKCARFFTGSVTSWILRIAVLVGFMGAWQYQFNHANQGSLASPRAVAAAFYNLTFQTHTIFAPLFNSLELFGAGFATSLILGVPIGLVMGRYRRFELMLDPYVSFLYALPIVVFVPIMVIWLGFAFNFGVVFVIISAVFVVIINTAQGVHSVDLDLIETGRSYCASERKILRTIVIPSTIPYIIAGARLAFSVSWIGVIVSEVVSSETGLGGQITAYITSFLQADAVVPVLYIAIISVVIVGLANRYSPRLTPWANVNN